MDWFVVCDCFVSSESVGGWMSHKTLHNSFKVVFGSLNVECNCFLLDRLIRANYHNVGRRRELFNKSGKFFILNHHWLELVVRFNARQLKLLNNVRNLLKAVSVFVICRVIVLNHQKGWLFKKDHFVCFDCLAKPLQRMFQLVNVGQQNWHNFRPSLVKSLIPNWRFETLGFLFEILRGHLHNLEHFFVEFFLTTLLWH